MYKPSFLIKLHSTFPPADSAEGLGEHVAVKLLCYLHPEGAARHDL